MVMVMKKMKSSVWLLERHDYDDYGLLGAYKTEEMATKAKARKDSRTILAGRDLESIFYPRLKELDLYHYDFLHHACNLVPEWLDYEYGETSKYHVTEVKVNG